MFSKHSESGLARIKYLYKMKGIDLYIPISSFQVISLINQDNILKNYLVQEFQTGKKYTAKSLNIISKNFQVKIEDYLLREFKIINNLFSKLFFKFHWFCSEDFNFENYPVIITDELYSKTLLDFIKDHNYPINFSLTKKLINIYGIALAFLIFHNFFQINADIKLESIYETDDFYPKIDFFSFLKREFS